MCVRVPSHWTTTTHNHWSLFDRLGLEFLRFRIDHLIRDEFACNPLLSDLVIDLDDEPDVNNVTRGSDQSKSSDCFTHAMVNARCRDFPRSVLLADTIVESCGLGNFEQTSWSTQRRHKFWRCHDELETEADYHKFVDSFEDNYLGVCNGRSLWMIDCGMFDDPECDKSLRIHVGRNPRDHEVHHGCQELS